jgi:hypothetical protein
MDGIAESVRLLLITLKEEQVKGVNFMTIKNVNERHGTIGFATYHKPSAETEGEIDDFPIEIDGLN